MEQLQKDNSQDRVFTLSEFFWEYLAPGFMIKLRNRYRVIKLKRYKMRKVKKESKVLDETTYHMEFNVVINDQNNPQTLGPFYIDIPARGAFFAKRKLLSHIREVVDVDVINFERADEIEETNQD